jgi:hypothetical protein
MRMKSGFSGGLHLRYRLQPLSRHATHASLFSRQVSKSSVHASRCRQLQVDLIQLNTAVRRNWLWQKCRVSGIECNDRSLIERQRGKETINEHQEPIDTRPYCRVSCSELYVRFGV